MRKVETFLIFVFTLIQLGCTPALVNVNFLGSLNAFFSPWSTSMGAGNLTDSVWSSGGGGGSVLTDSFRNTTYCATTTGQITTTFVGSGVGPKNSYVAHFNSAGILQWSIEFGLSGIVTTTYGCLLDNSGDGSIYLAAQTAGNFTGFGFSALPAGSILGAENALLIKISASGTILWRNQLQANVATAQTGLNGAYFDSSNNIVLVGGVSGGSGNLSGTSIGVSGVASTASNAFVIKINPTSGAAAWIDNVSPGGSANIQLTSLFTDASQNIYAGGTTNGQVATTLLNTGGTSGLDVFFLKIQPSGVLSTSGQQGDGTGNSLGNGGNNLGLQLDSAGNLLLWSSAMATTAPALAHIGSAAFSTTGNDLFILSFNPSVSNTLNWGRRIQGGSTSFSNFTNGNNGNQGGVIVFPATSKIYLVGSTSGSIGAPVGVQGNQNIFFVTMDTLANVSINIEYGPGSTGFISPQSAFVDGSGNLLMTGSVGNSILGGTMYGTSGMQDLFAMKLSNTGSLVWTTQHGGGGGPSGGFFQVSTTSFDAPGTMTAFGDYEANTMGNPSISPFLFGTNGSEDAFAVQFSQSTGAEVWSTQWGAGPNNALNMNGFVEASGGFYLFGSVTAQSGNVSNFFGTFYGPNGPGTTDAALFAIDTAGPVHP